MSGGKLIERLVRVLLIVAILALIVMATIIALNVLGRALLGKPILGAIDIAGLAGVVFASVAIGYVESQHRNVIMEVVSARFPARVKAFTDAFGLLLSLVVIGVLTWAMFGAAHEAATSSETTLVTRIPLAPFKYIWAVGATLLSIVLIKNMVASVIRGIKR